MDTLQGTPAWFRARQGKLTASRFGAAAGVCPYTSRQKALRQVLEVEKFEGNPACTWGTQNEKNAVKDYMIRTGNVVRTTGLHTHPHHDWLAGSPDGLVGDEGMIEVKCPFYNMTPHTTIPRTYYCQMNGLMEILDREWCDYVSWTPTKMKIYRVYRDRELFQALMDRYTVFYAHMKRGCATMPSVRAAEKEAVCAWIDKSAETTDHAFWEYLDPLRSPRWDSPPAEQCSDESSDESTAPRKLPKLLTVEAVHCTS